MRTQGLPPPRGNLALEGRPTGRGEWSTERQPTPCRDPRYMRGQGQLQMDPSPLSPPTRKRENAQPWATEEQPENHLLERPRECRTQVPYMKSLFLPESRKYSPATTATFRCPETKDSVLQTPLDEAQSRSCPALHLGITFRNRGPRRDKQGLRLAKPRVKLGCREKKGRKRWSRDGRDWRLGCRLNRATAPHRPPRDEPSRSLFNRAGPRLSCHGTGIFPRRGETRLVRWAPCRWLILGRPGDSRRFAPSGTNGLTTGRRAIPSASGRRQHECFILSYFVLSTPAIRAAWPEHDY